MDKVDRLIKANAHLRIALAELSKIAGSSYVGGLRELRRLVSVKMKVETILEEMMAGEKKELRLRRKVDG